MIKTKQELINRYAIKYLLDEPEKKRSIKKVLSNCVMKPKNNLIILIKKEIIKLTK